jgi:hypothetical protein
MIANKYTFRSELERLIENYHLLGVLEEKDANKISIAVGILLPEQEYPRGNIIPFLVPVCSEEERQAKTAWQNPRRSHLTDSRKRRTGRVQKAVGEETESGRKACIPGCP